MKKNIIILLIAFILIFLLFYYAKGKIWENDCKWKPTKDYGNCEMVLPGIYFDGTKCNNIGSGCSLRGDNPPFRTLSQCKMICEL